ncbi:MAG TPA: IS66 family transposase [Tepidisphaeraceae bacterium]|jgi:hypothetical protein|nr:IS66 family transposase [Tepidisphaeraceae bacterium]
MDRHEYKAYERFKEQAQHFRQRAYDLEAEARVNGPELYRAHLRIGDLEQRVAGLKAENALLKRRLEEVLAAGASGDAGDKPAVAVKASVKRRRRKKPGRKAGHAAALRPMPDHVDAQRDVPLPRDPAGGESCPRCNASLLDVEDREHLIEDIIPAKVVVSGSSGTVQRLVSFVPQAGGVARPGAAAGPLVPARFGQVGLNALATAMVLRIVHRLPFRQVRQIFLDLPNFSISPGAVADQVQRVARWLEGNYEQTILKLRCANVVHADETGWRTDGKNGWLWAATSPTDTLFRVDKSRGGKVIVDLLGKAFGGTLVSDFHSAYLKMDCKKQKCLCHLLRELVESAEKSEAFKTGPFFHQAKRLVKQLLLLKSRWDQLDDNTYTSRACALEDKLDRLLQSSYDEPNAIRLAKRMRKYRKELTAFLWDKDLAGTNNAAERALRPAVVFR